MSENFQTFIAAAASAWLEDAKGRLSSLQSQRANTAGLLAALTAQLADLDAQLADLQSDVDGAPALVDAVTSVVSIGKVESPVEVALP
jgi:capsule polysaccharide export protein KpsE/RkpR